MTATSGSVIEELTITVEPGMRDDYLRRDAAVWTPYLESCDGFLGKETWLPDDRPDTVVFVIRWASMAKWKSITPEQVAEVDARMGAPAAVSIDCRSYRLS